MKIQKSLLVTILLVFFIGNNVVAKSQFPIDLDPIFSSNALKWNIYSMDSWVDFLLKEKLITEEEKENFPWKRLYYSKGNTVFYAIHSFLDGTRLFSQKEIMDSFGMEKFNAEEWPKNGMEWGDMFSRELQPIEVGTVCARLTAVLAQKKGMPALIEMDKQWLSRYEPGVAQIQFSSAHLHGFGNADLLVSISSSGEIIKDGSLYTVYYGADTVEVTARGNSITFPLQGRIDWGIAVSRSDRTTFQDMGIEKLKFPVKVKIEGTVEYFGTKKQISENAIVPQEIMPLLEIHKVGEYTFKYIAETIYRINNSGGLALIFQEEIFPNEISINISINNRNVILKLTKEEEGNFYHFSSPFDLSINPGEDEIIISFPNGENPNITWLGLYPDEVADYVFINDFDPPSPWEG